MTSGFLFEIKSVQRRELSCLVERAIDHALQFYVERSNFDFQLSLDGNAPVVVRDPN